MTKAHKYIFWIVGIGLIAEAILFVCVSRPDLIFWKNSSPQAPAVAEDDPYVDLLNLGKKYYEDDNDDAAMKSWDDAVALDPNRPEAYTYQSIIANSTGDSKEEMRLLNLAISKDPSYGYAYEFRANAYNNQEKYKLALADATKAIETGYFTYRVYDYRAVDYLNEEGSTTQEGYTQALSDSHEAIKLEPDDSQAFVIEGVALYGLGVCQGAIDAYDTALDLSHGGEFEADMRNTFWDNFDAKNCVDDPRDSDQDQSLPTSTPTSDPGSGIGV
jgi:tetratricopeptide (TPR) repeat protein